VCADRRLAGVCVRARVCVTHLPGRAPPPPPTASVAFHLHFPAPIVVSKRLWGYPCLIMP